MFSAGPPISTWGRCSLQRDIGNLKRYASSDAFQIFPIVLLGFP